MVKLNNYKVTAFDLKLALLEQYRFKKGYLAVDECNLCDIIADNGKEVIEIEVKISKYDLLNGEKKKEHKHKSYANANKNSYRRQLIPNKYYFCVPTPLVSMAIDYTKVLNPSYGVIEFKIDEFLKKPIRTKYDHHGKFLRVAKRVKKLHPHYSRRYHEVISKRLSTKVITLMQEKFRNSL